MQSTAADPWRVPANPGEPRIVCRFLSTVDGGFYAYDAYSDRIVKLEPVEATVLSALRRGCDDRAAAEYVEQRFPNADGLQECARFRASAKAQDIFQPVARRSVAMPHE